MLTDKELKTLNEQVYQVDPNYKSKSQKVYTNKADDELKERERNRIRIADNTLKVISVKNGKWGFQGMAVAPVKGGHVDYSQVTVVAAGTDPSQPIDLLEAFDATTNIGSL